MTAPLVALPLSLFLALC